MSSCGGEGLGLGCVICTAETYPEQVSSRECESGGHAKVEKAKPQRTGQRKENVLEGERGAKVNQHYGRLLCVLGSKKGVVMSSRIKLFSSLGQ